MASVVWKIIALLWLIPLAAGLSILARVVRGSPALSDKEWLLFFGDTKEKPLSFWSWLKFGVFVVLFFIVGLVEGLVLLNIGSLWLVAVPLLTGLAAMLVLLHWLR